MAEVKTNKKRKVIIRILIAAVFFAIVHFLFRGPYLSNSIKRVVIPVLENVTGKRVIMDKAVINLFPFYIQGKSVKFIDEDGKRLLWITKSRIYLDIIGLLSKEVRIRRIALTEPKLTITDDELAEIIERIKAGLSVSGPDQFKVSLKSLKLTDGEFTYTAKGGSNTFLGNGLYADMLIKDTAQLDFKLDQGTLNVKDLSGFDYKLKGRLIIANGRVRIPEIVVSYSDSNIAAAGEVSFNNWKIGNGEFSGKAIIHEADIGRIFRAENETDGVLTLDGTVGIDSDNNSDIPAFALNLEGNGHFYLETLMDILKVKENVKGRIAVNGKITGVFPEIVGEGDAKINDAEFGRLPIDSGLGKIEYKDGRFVLSNFTAHAYEGVLSGNAHIDIPIGDFGVTASVTEVDSVKLMNYIGWDAPFRPGWITGNFDLLKIIGKDIDVNAFLSYKNTTDSDEKFIDRIKGVEGNIVFSDKVVTISNSKISSLNTTLSIDGTVDTRDKIFGLDVQIDGRDIADLSAPYYSDIKGQCNFTGKASGPFEDPVITGTLKMGRGHINGFKISDASADITRSIKSLVVRDLTVNQSGASLKLKGGIDFQGSSGLFSFDSPFYNAKASFNNIEAESLADAFFKTLNLTGRLNGEISFKGDNKDFTGDGHLVITEGDIYGQKFDKISADLILDSEKLDIRSVDMRKGGSGIAASGSLYFDKRFKISAGSEKVSSEDISYLTGLQLASLFTLKLDGSGTFEKPDVSFSVGLLDSSFRGVDIGEGKITGSIKGHRLSARGSLLDDRITADVKVVLSESPSWTADVDFKKGRYDFLLAGLISDPPKDLSVFAEGHISVKSEKSKISMGSRFNSLTFSLYGYDFRNNGDIILDLKGDDLSIKAFSLVGKDANLNIQGDVFLGKSYDVNLEGDIDLLPLQVLTDKITSLEGRGNFAVDISGNWGKPEIIGELDVRGTTLGFKGFPHKIGPLNGKVFFNRDKVIFDSIKGDFAGGKVILYGAGYLDKLSFNRLLVSADMTAIKLSPIKGVNAAFDSKLFFEASSKGSSLTGEILLKKAQYKKDVEFKKLFLGLKEMDVISSKQTWFDKTLLNIRIVGIEDIYIDNNIAKTPVRVDLTLTGTPARYGLIGLIESGGGSIFFRGNEFKLLEASSVDFVAADNVSPILHLKAETSTGGYRVKMNLDGPLDNFTLTLFSNPHLSEMDILTLLSFGSVGAEGRGVEGGMAASQATSLLTGGITSEVTEGFKYITGFDRFEVEPHTTATGSISPRITVGKRFLDEKMSVVYSTSIGSTEENVVRMEYDLGNNISIVGSRDEIGSTGADVKYKFKFK
ncbi:MAG: translocation/assembly module TamB domain-containing protein [Thermodesulfovibrionia bacterium]|nr:translocation/assembly module TamB domain-containing protein [Thermodesulfovibrionia bacterium]